MPLTEVKDEAFSTKTMGGGLAVIPSIGRELYAPADGTVKDGIPYSACSGYGNSKRQ
ncbi:PTS glucose transporter subunit IIA [Paenibacillus polymyxa]|uniref:PTS glucose transporter subunit IIA n=1 Tax=Paenibacillus polymyxa TaxID=1406 RepID=UPI003593630F